MTPEQFLAKLAKQPPSAVYLFLGQEGYHRRICKHALLDRALPAEVRTSGFTQTDLEDCSLAEVIDDARSLSLFSGDRLIWVTSAELALPKRLAASSDETEEGKASLSPLAAYLKKPTPGTVIVFECSRFDFTGDDKPKLDRVEKFFSGIRDVVEFRQFTPESCRFLAQQTAKTFQLQLAGAELAALLESVAGDANRLVAEIEKLSLYKGAGGDPVTMDDIRTLIPNASQSTIFVLVNALGKRDRPAALQSLDVLVREGEYLPLALTFLSTLFRLALTAKESKISSAQQAQSYFQQMGVRMWRDRAEQVIATAAAFSQPHLGRAVAAIYETDKKFRDGYRDDRLVMETLILALT